MLRVTLSIFVLMARGFYSLGVRVQHPESYELANSEKLKKLIEPGPELYTH